MVSIESPRLPLVSVVIPVYNSADYVREAIDSVLAQTYSNIQVIAVDDGSTDNSLAVLQTYGEAIDIVTQDNSGSAVARNRGIGLAKGDFIAFLDADDLWHPAKINLQVEHLLEHPDIGLVYADWLLARPGQEELVGQLLAKKISAAEVRLDPTGSGWVYTRLLVDCILHTSSVIVRRSTVEQTGLFDVDLRKGQDYDFWLRMSRHTEMHKLTPKLSVYRIHESGITQSASAQNYGATVVESALARWGRSGPDGSELSSWAIRNRLSWLWYSFAFAHRDEGNFEVARAAFKQSAAYAPWRFSFLVRYLECSIRAW